MKTFLWSGVALWIVAIIGHDLYLGFCTDAPTYTMDIRRIASRWPIIPAAVGLIIGFLLCHFFWWD